MKSPRAQLIKLFKNIVYKYILYTLLVMGILLGVKYIFTTYVTYSLYNKSVPGSSVHVNSPFLSKVYFNNTLGESTFLDQVVKVIDESKKSVEVAMFSFDSQKVKDALYRAHDRGVQVTLVLDSSRKEKHSLVFYDLPPDIKRIDVGSSDKLITTQNIYMHHKFLISDRGDSVNNTLVTGSMDFTSKGEKYEQSFYLITQDKSLVDTYGRLFDILSKDISSTKKFKDFTYNPWLTHIEYTDSYIDLWASPGFKTHSSKYKIIDSIKAAQKDISILMWQFNDKDIADALLQSAKRGVTVTLITDDLVSDGVHSSVPFLQKQITKQSIKNFTVLLDSASKKFIDTKTLGENFNPFIHHHAMIVDDQTLFVGTNNWTSWGFYKNDEDTLVTNNVYLIQEFQKTFNYFFKVLK